MSAAMVTVVAGLGGAWGSALAVPAPAELTEPLAVADDCGTGPEVQFTIAATGDTFPHERIQQVGEAQGYDVLFDDVRPFLQAADLAYTNFDGAMLEGAGYTGYPAFNFNPELAEALAGAGIDLVSTANNHILDRGPQGLDATLDVFDRTGIAHHGAVRSDSERRPAYLEVELERDGVTVSVGFISATWGTNGIPDPNNQVNLLYNSHDYGQQGGLRQEIRDAIASAAAETDVVVVAAHFGFEYQFYPDRTQVEAATQMAQAGADIILGAQPHTLQPVDVIDVGDRRTWVFYSLANFLAAQGSFQEQYYSATSAIFFIGLAADAAGEVRVTGFRYLPTIHVDSDTRPAPIEQGSHPAVMEHVRTILRDPDGARQLPARAPGAGTTVLVCPEQAVAPPSPTVTPSPPAASPSPSPASPRPTDSAEGTEDAADASAAAASAGFTAGQTIMVVAGVVLAGLVLSVLLRRRTG